MAAYGVKTGIRIYLDSGDIPVMVVLTVAAVLLVLTTLLIGNIPTLVLLAVYWAAREKRRMEAQMDKMHIDDL